MSNESKKEQPRAMSPEVIAGLNSEFESMEQSIRGYVDERLAGLGETNPNRVAVAASRRPSMVLPWVLAGLAFLVVGWLVWRVVVLEATVARLEVWLPQSKPSAAQGAASDESPVGGNLSTTRALGMGPTLAPLSTFVAEHRLGLSGLIDDAVASRHVAPGSVTSAAEEKLSALSRMLISNDPLANKDLETIRDGLFEYLVHRAWLKAELPPPAGAAIDGKVESEEYPLTALAPLWADLGLPAPEFVDDSVRQRVVRAAVLPAR